MIDEVESKPEPYLDVFLIKEIISGKQVALCHDRQDAEDIINCINFYYDKVQEIEDI